MFIFELDIIQVTTVLIVQNKWENNGTEKIDLVTPTPDQQNLRCCDLKRDLKIPRSMLWVRSKIEVTELTQYPTGALSFRVMSTEPTILKTKSTDCILPFPGVLTHTFLLFLSVNIKLRWWSAPPIYS